MTEAPFAAADSAEERSDDRAAAVDRAIDLQAALRRLTLLTVTLVLLLAGLGTYVYVRLSDLADKGARAHSAVCVLRADEIRRVTEAQKFIADHPDGFAGITVTSLQSTILSQERTITALAVADCGD